jgi:hypothetical protein
VDLCWINSLKEGGGVVIEPTHDTRTDSDNSRLMSSRHLAD